MCNIYRRYLLAVLIFFIFTMCGDAFAQKVYSPTVVTGEKAMELFIDRASDSNSSKDGKTRYELEFEFTPLEYWSVGVYGVWDKPANSDDAEYTKSKIEVIRQLTEQGKYFIDLGIYFEYQKMNDRFGKNDALEFKLLLEKEIGKTTLTLNPVFVKELNNSMATLIALEYEAAVKYRYSKIFSPGLEFYGDLGQLYNTRPLDEKKQYAGPVIYGKEGSLVYRFGFLFGLNELSDDMITSLTIEYEWF